MKNKNIKDYGESSNFSAIHSFSQPGQPYNPNEYAKSFKNDVDKYIKDCKSKGVTPNATKIPSMKDEFIPLLGRFFVEIKNGYVFHAMKIYNENKLNSLIELANQVIKSIDNVFKILDDYDDSVLPYKNQLKSKLNGYKGYFQEYLDKINAVISKKNGVETPETKNENKTENKPKKSVKSFKNIKQLFNDGYYFTDSLKEYIQRTEGISKNDINKDFILSPELKEIYYSVGKDEFLKTLNFVYKKFKSGHLNIDNQSLQMKNLKNFLSESKKDKFERDFSQIIGGPYNVTFAEVNYNIMIIYDKYTDKVYFSTYNEFTDTPFTHIFGEHDIDLDEYLEYKNEFPTRKGFSSGQAEYINAKNNEYFNESNKKDIDFDKDHKKTFENFALGMNELGKGEPLVGRESVNRLLKKNPPRYINEISFDAGDFDTKLSGTGDGKNIPNYTMTTPVKISEVVPSDKYATLSQVTFRTLVNTYNVKDVKWNEVNRSIINKVVNYLNQNKISDKVEDISPNNIKIVDRRLDYSEDKYTDLLDKIALGLDELKEKSENKFSEKVEETNENEVLEKPEKTENKPLEKPEKTENKPLEKPEEKTKVGDAGSSSGRYDPGYGYDESETKYSSLGFVESNIEENLKELDDILAKRLTSETYVKFNKYRKQINKVLKGDFDPEDLTPLQEMVLSLRNDLDDYIWRIDFMITGYIRESDDENAERKTKSSSSTQQPLTSSQFMRNLFGLINKQSLYAIPEKDLENPTEESQKLVDKFRIKLIKKLADKLKDFNDSDAENIINFYNDRLLHQDSYFDKNGSSKYAKYKNYEFKPMTLEEIRSNSTTKKDSLSISDQALMLHKLIKQPKKVIQCKDNFIKVYFKDMKSLNDAMCDNNLWGYEYDCSTSLADKNPHVKFAECDIDDYIKKETK